MATIARGSNSRHIEALQLGPKACSSARAPTEEMIATLAAIKDAKKIHGIIRGDADALELRPKQGCQRSAGLPQHPPYVMAFPGVLVSIVTTKISLRPIHSSLRT